MGTEKSRAFWAATRGMKWRSSDICTLFRSFSSSWNCESIEENRGLLLSRESIVVGGPIHSTLPDALSIKKPKGWDCGKEEEKGNEKEKKMAWSFFLMERNGCIKELKSR
ncbi:hypothetical protein J1N35_024662 [Gossypium stocksii]|uniref:Uncharacterized protein n=1 Tax=Gossypium stocksii TaxID=47602 RepID=A0A9D3ZX29_9ROSI|nr:hypothetical protein J1N35_024662 [Gossypium stocksii]